MAFSVCKVILLFNIAFFTCNGWKCAAEKFQYISTEHPTVSYFNPKFFAFINLTSQRYGRHDPFYYVGLHMHLLQAWGNNVTVDFYFYEWLTNAYKRGFVEMHFKWCDLIHKDKFFGSAMRQGNLAKPCPHPPFQYISTEHPTVSYFNPKFIAFANLTSQRYGRHDPFYYVGLHMHLLQALGNNVTVDFYFYEWLTNAYKRGFVEMHFKWCDLIHKDKFFGSAMRQGKFAKPYPHPPDTYHLYNMTIPLKSIPPHFPFRKGRIIANVTATETNECMGYGHIDMEIKEYNTKRNKQERN